MRKKTAGLAVSTILAVALFWQNCSDVSLHNMGSFTGFSGTGFPLDILPPTDYKIHRRVVVLMDMSNSMVSGPCPYDIDNDPYAPMFTLEPHVPYDPNKGTGDLRDGRALAWDCQVRTEMPQMYGEEKIARQLIIPYPDYSSNPPPGNKQYSTYVGIDPDGDRFTIAKKWYDQLNGNLTPAAKSRVKMSIIPITGGRRQTNMLSKVGQSNGALPDLKLFNLTDPNIFGTISILKTIHDFDTGQVRLPDYFRWDKTTMGTTAPGDLLDDLYRTLRADMESLIPTKALPFARYDVFYLSDGRVRPEKKNFIDALNLLPQCRPCSGDPNMCAQEVTTCPGGGGDGGGGSGSGPRGPGGGGGQCTPQKGTCAKLVDEMREAWGNPEPNTLDALELNWSLIEGMPKYYGGGLLKIGLVKLKPTKVQNVSAPGEVNSFDELGKRFKERGLRVKLLEAPGDEPPVALANPADEIKVFKLTDIFFYNSNVRVGTDGKVKIDTDGDGLSDSEEAVLGTNPKLQRTDGACLDIIATNPAYKALCEKMAEDKSCGATFDADHDDLNECDERALGTDDRDFDTDGDAIPDSLEVIYGFNPLEADAQLDTNGDSVPNVVNFAAGLPPQAKLSEVPNNLQIRFRANFVGNKTIPDDDYGQVKIDQYAVSLDNAPVSPIGIINPASQGKMYQLPEARLTPAELPLYLIDPRLRLLTYAQVLHTNTITALIRIVDPREPEIVFWRLLRFPLSVQGLAQPLSIDNSAFKLLPAVDYDGGQQ